MGLKQILVVMVIAGAMLASPSWAITRQQVIVQFDPTPDDGFNNDETRDDDAIDDRNGDIDRAITAQIGQKVGNSRVGDFFARGSVGAFGELGVEGETIAVGELDTQILIESDDFQNITGRAQQATVRFIIDGGRASMFAGAGSVIDFTMTVRKDFDTVFQTAFELLALPGGVGNQLTLFGDDIGIAVNPLNGVVEIPLAFVSADLGIIPPNERFSLEYQLDITATIVGFAEVAFFEFSDPFGVDMGGPFTGIVEFQPVPLPASAPLMLGAVALLARLGKRRRGRGIGRLHRSAPGCRLLASRPTKIR